MHSRREREREKEKDIARNAVEASLWLLFVAVGPNCCKTLAVERQTLLHFSTMGKSSLKLAQKDKIYAHKFKYIGSLL